MSEELWKKKVELFRSRFNARTDVFAVKKEYTRVNKDTVTGATTIEDVKLVAPQCGNYGDKAVCQIAQKNSLGCTGCPGKRYNELTDQEIWKHIAGEQEVVLYMLQKEGIRFGACDFDKGNTFEDAKAVKDLSVKLGVPCYVSRSTKKGYHVYWFFADFVQPFEFTSFIRHVYEELGFYQRWHLTPEIGLPEVFPKQGYGDGRLGNGIKIPMIEPRMREGRNCWVNDLAEPIDSNQQWDYLEKTELIQPEMFRSILVEQKVEILQAPASSNREKARLKEEKGETKNSLRPFGNFLNVVEGCPAMQRIWGKNEKGDYLGTGVPQEDKIDHDPYINSIWLAVHTVNGRDMVKARWGDKFTQTAIDYAESNNYLPPTCAALQQKGVCQRGSDPKSTCKTFCLKKMPPVFYEEGRRKVNPDDLPESQWNEPSPIRFATDRNLTADDIIERIGQIAKTLKAQSKKGKDDGDESRVFIHANPIERQHGLISRAVELGELDLAKIRSTVTGNKWMTKKEFDEISGRVKKEKKAEEVQKVKSAHKTVMINGDEYALINNCYERFIVDKEGVKTRKKMTNFNLEVHEEISTLKISSDRVDLVEITETEDRDIMGTVHMEDGKNYGFQMKHQEWGAPDKFFHALLKSVGTGLSYSRADHDHIRNCAGEFSKDGKVVRKSIRQIGYHTFKGTTVYLTPSVLIDKDSIIENKEFKIPPFVDDVSKDLDFKIISDDEFKDLGRHIVKDLFNANKPMFTMTAFAHAMQGVLIPQVKEAVGFGNNPILWLAGNQADGKTFIASAIQKFYGNFEVVQSANGTAKSRLGNGYNFRHAWMLVDDYKKHLHDPFGKEFPGLVQAAYDRSGRSALKRDGVPREKIDRIRGMLCITGEDILEADASSATRTIMMDIPLKMDRERGEIVAKRAKDYCGFTPRLVRFVLNMTNEEIAKLWNEYLEDFYKPCRTKPVDGDYRVCSNLTFNMLAFHITMEMMVAEGVIPEVQRDELCRVHQTNLAMIRDGIFEFVDKQLAARVFTETLREVLQNPARHYISGWPGYGDAFMADRNSTIIGYWRENTPETIYFLPRVTQSAVADLIRRNNGHLQTAAHIARHLHHMGYLDVEKVNRNRNEYTCQIRGLNKGDSVRVWPILIKALGIQLDLGKNNLKVVQKDQGPDPLPLEFGSPSKAD